MKKDKSLITIISFLLVIGFLITSFASYFVSRKSLRAEITLNELPLTSDNIYSEIQKDLLRPVFISSLMARDTFLRDWIIAGENDATQVTKYLKEIKDEFNTFTSFVVSEKTRNYYYADGILKKVTPDNERDAWYFRVREIKDEYEINVDPDMANKDMMTIFVNYRMFDYDGNYIGVTGVGLTVNAVKMLIEEYQKKYNRNIYFVDKKGDIQLAGSNFSKSFSSYAEEMLLHPERTFNYRNENGMVHVNTRYISEFGWYLVVEQPEAETTRHIFIALIINLGICFFITIIVLVLVSLSIKAYLSRIETLRGIVPICSYCKQIRDDKGYWNQVEAYVARHTDAEFSHGICPDCMQKHYPEFVDNSDDAF